MSELNRFPLTIFGNFAWYGYLRRVIGGIPLVIVGVPIYFFTYGGVKHGPLSKEDVGSLYDVGIVGLDLPITGNGSARLTVRDVVLSSGDEGVFDQATSEVKEAVSTK